MDFLCKPIADPSGKQAVELQDSNTLAAEDQYTVCTMHGTQTQHPHDRICIIKAVHIHICSLCQTVCQRHSGHMEHDFFAQFQKALKKGQLATAESQKDFFGKFDWWYMTKQDMAVWNQIADFLKA